MNATKLEPATALAELKETKPDSVTLVVLSGDMDKAMAAFIIATGAAAMGMKVTMFFTFWGLNIIRKEGCDQLSKRLDARAFGWINKGGTRIIFRYPDSHFGGLGYEYDEKGHEEQSHAGHCRTVRDGSRPWRANDRLHHNLRNDGYFQRYSDRWRRPTGRSQHVSS